MKYCIYYQAKVKEKDCWYLVALLRSCEHLAFDRTLDTSESIFEFFVPYENEAEFINLMEYFIKNNIISNLKKVENRLKNPDALI